MIMKSAMLLASLVSCQPMQADHAVGGKTSTDVFADKTLRALADAACIGDVKAMDAAIKAGADVNGRGLSDSTPLIWTISCENNVGLDALLARGADPDLPAGPLYPVAVTATFRKPDMLRILLSHKTNPNPKSINWVKTPLQRALVTSKDFGNIENLKLLLKAGADVNTPTSATKNVTVLSDALTFNRPNEALLMMNYSFKGDLDDLASHVNLRIKSGSMNAEAEAGMRKLLVRIEQERTLRKAGRPTNKAKQAQDVWKAKGKWLSAAR